MTHQQQPVAGCAKYWLQGMCHLLDIAVIAAKWFTAFLLIKIAATDKIETNHGTLWGFMAAGLAEGLLRKAYRPWRLALTIPINLFFAGEEAALVLYNSLYYVFGLSRALSTILGLSLGLIQAYSELVEFLDYYDHYTKRHFFGEIFHSITRTMAVGSLLIFVGNKTGNINNNEQQIGMLTSFLIDFIGLTSMAYILLKTSYEHILNRIMTLLIEGLKGFALLAQALLLFADQQNNNTVSNQLFYICTTLAVIVACRRIKQQYNEKREFMHHAFDQETHQNNDIEMPLLNTLTAPLNEDKADAYAGQIETTSITQRLMGYFYLSQWLEGKDNNFTFFGFKQNVREQWQLLKDFYVQLLFNTPAKKQASTANQLTMPKTV